MKDFFSRDDSKSDILVGGLAVFCLVLCSKLVASFMPGAVVMLAAGIFVALFALFAMLIWREQPRDEREAQLIMASDRLGFLAGSIVLSAGVVIQTLRHEDATLLVVALVVMIIAKLLGKYIQK